MELIFHAVLNSVLDGYASYGFIREDALLGSNFELDNDIRAFPDERWGTDKAAGHNLLLPLSPSTPIISGFWRFF